MSCGKYQTILAATAALQLKVELRRYRCCVLIGWFVLCEGANNASISKGHLPSGLYQTGLIVDACFLPDTICKAETLTPQNWIHEDVRRNTLEMPAWSGCSRKALVEEGIVYGSLRGHVCKPGALQTSQWRWVLQDMCSSSALKAEYVNTKKWISKEGFKAGTIFTAVLRSAFKTTAAFFWFHCRHTGIFPTAN